MAGTGIYFLSSALKYRGLPQKKEPLGKALSNALWIAKLRTQVAKNTGTCGEVKPVAISSQF
jgi:hypothetical protein